RWTAGASRAPSAKPRTLPRPQRRQWTNCAGRAAPRSFPRLESRPLQGRGILITRPAGQAQRLASLVEAAGGRPILFPAIEIEPLPERAPPRGNFDLIIFVSPSAVRCAAGRMDDSGARVAAVASGTRRELEAHGFRDVLAPQEGA